MANTKIKVKTAADKFGLTVEEFVRRLAMLGYFDYFNPPGPDDWVDKEICKFAEWSRK